jgi:hypothetical protein
MLDTIVQLTIVDVFFSAEAYWKNVMSFPSFDPLQANRQFVMLMYPLAISLGVRVVSTYGLPFNVTALPILWNFVPLALQL